MILAYMLALPAITPALLAAFFWKRAPSAGAATSLAAAPAATLAWKASGIVVVDAVIPAIGVSITSLVLVSPRTPPPREKVAPSFPPS
jgi:Na+/proline symporter